MSEYYNVRVWAREFRKLADQMSDLQDQLETLKRSATRNYDPGKYDWGTVYVVREHKVRAHTRRETKRVKFNTQKI